MRWTHAFPRISLIRFLLTGEFSQICKEFSFCISNLDQSFVLCFWPTFGAPCKFPVESIVELLHRQLPVLLCRLNSRCFVGEHRNQIKISYWKCKYLFPSPPASLPPWRVAAKLCVPSVGEVRALWSACPRIGLPLVSSPFKNGKLFETCSETGSSKLTLPSAPLLLLHRCYFSSSSASLPLLLLFRSWWSRRRSRLRCSHAHWTYLCRMICSIACADRSTSDVLFLARVVKLPAHKCCWDRTCSRLCLCLCLCLCQTGVKLAQQFVKYASSCSRKTT